MPTKGRSGRGWRLARAERPIHLVTPVDALPPLESIGSAREGRTVLFERHQPDQYLWLTRILPAENEEPIAGAAATNHAEDRQP